MTPPRTESTNIDTDKRNKNTRQGTRKRAMKKTNDIELNHNIYETNYQATYEANHEITTDEAENLMNKHYRTFPTTRSTYKLDGNNMTINYAIDDCN